MCIGKNKEYATHKYTKSFHSFASRNVLEMLCVACIFCDVVRIVCKMQQQKNQSEENPVINCTVHERCVLVWLIMLMHLWQTLHKP